MTPLHPSIALALLGRDPPQRSLRIGLLLAGASVPRWAAEAIELIRGGPQLEIAAAVIWRSGATANPFARPAGRWIFDAYRARCPQAKMLQPLAAAKALDAIPVRELDGDGARQYLRALNLDVIVALDAGPREGSCEGLARHGVWSVAWGDPLVALQTPAFFWEVCQDTPATTATLLSHARRFESARIVQRVVCATVKSFYYTLNARDAPAMMKHVLVQRLYDLLIHGSEAFERRPDWRAGEFEVRSADRPPDPVRLGAFLFRHALTSRRVSSLNARTFGEWFAACRSDVSRFTAGSQRFVPGGFEELPLRAKGFGCADPFPVRWQDRDLVFVEEILPNRHGRLAVYSRDDKGHWQTPPEVILEGPHHLSYPCVFEHDGEYFFIPESSHAGNVELWRATEFPYRWTLDTVYAAGVNLVDTTPLHHNGQWYFFTASRAAGSHAMEFLIYHSAHLRGPWRAHPRNPIGSDIRSARMAGHVFARRGRLIRPAQDCSGSYGKAIRLFEIVRLTPAEYEEREEERIDAGWHPLAERTHTLNASRFVETIDGWRRFPISDRRV